MQPVLGDHMQPSFFHSSVFAAVVPDTTLVDVVRHRVVTSPPAERDDATFGSFAFVFIKVKDKFTFLGLFCSNVRSRLILLRKAISV